MSISVFEDLIAEGKLSDRARPVLSNIQRRLRGFTDFTPLQKTAFFETERFWDPKSHLLVCGATSAGKTLVAEIAMQECLCRDRNVIYLAPLRSMVTEKYRTFRNDLEGTAFKNEWDKRVCASDKDHQGDDFEITEGNFSVAVIVYEKFYALLAQGKADEMLRNCGLIVFDEIQMLANEDRGVKILMALINAIKCNSTVRTVFMTTSYSNMSDAVGVLEKSLPPQDGSPCRIEQIFDSQSSMALEEMVLCCDGSYRGKYTPSIRDTLLPEEELARKLEQKRTELGTDAEGEGDLLRTPIDEIIPDAGRTNNRERKINLLMNVIRMHQGKKIIAFIHSRSTCKRLAETIAKAGFRSRCELSQELKEQLQTLESEELRDTFTNTLFPCGVAYHHGGLSQAARDIVESEFSRENGALSVILATETLAIGVNLPADVIVVYDTEHRSSEDDRVHPIDTQTYKNHIGRAGRLGLSDDGFIPRSYLLAMNRGEMRDYWDRYINAKPTRILPAYEALRIDTGMPYFLSLLGKKSLSARELNDNLRTQIPSMYSEGVFDLLLGDTSRKPADPALTPLFLRAWEAAGLLGEDIGNPDAVLWGEPYYKLSNFGSAIVPYALSVRSCAQIARSFLSTPTKENGAPNILLQYGYVNDRSEQPDLIPLLFFVCRMPEIQRLHRIYVPAFQDDAQKYNSFRDVLHTYLRQRREVDPHGRYEELLQCFERSEPSSDTLTAALRAVVLDLWARGLPLDSFRSEIKLCVPIEEGDVERLADTVSFVLEAIASSLTAAEDARLRKYATPFRALSNRVKYGGGNDLIRILSCHVYGLSRSAVIRLKKVLIEENLFGGSLFTYFSSNDERLKAIAAGLTSEQYVTVCATLKSRYDCKKTAKLLYNLQGDAIIPQDLGTCLENGALPLDNVALFLEIVSSHEKTSFLLRKCAAEKTSAPLYRLSGSQYDLYCIAVPKEIGVLTLYSKYMEQFDRHPGKYVIVATEEALEEMKKDFTAIKACTFAFYSPEKLLRLYLETLMLEERHAFLCNLQHLEGLIEEITPLPADTAPALDGFDVFLSYSHHESGGLVPDLFDRLRARGKRVFLDIVSIPVGESFPRLIAEGIVQSSIYVTLLNEEYSKGRWTKAELEQIGYQLVEHDKRLVPVCLDNKGLALLEECGLGGKNAIVASAHSYHEMLDRIISAACD